MVIPSKEKLNAWFGQQGSKYKDLSQEEKTEYMRRLSHSCNAAAALFDSNVAAVWPGEVPLLEAALAAIAPLRGSAGAPAEASDGRALSAQARARLSAKRSTARSRRPRAAGAQRSHGNGTQQQAGAAPLPESGQQQPPELHAPPRRRNGGKRRPGA